MNSPITKLPYGDFELHGYGVRMSLDDVNGALWNVYKLDATGATESERVYVTGDRDRAIEWIEHTYELNVGQHQL